MVKGWYREREGCEGVSHKCDCFAQDLKQQLEQLRERVLQGGASSGQQQQQLQAAELAAALSQPLVGQVADLQQRLLHCTAELRNMDAKAKKYKSAVRALQVREGGRQGQKVPARSAGVAGPGTCRASHGLARGSPNPVEGYHNRACNFWGN